MPQFQNNSSVMAFGLVNGKILLSEAQSMGDKGYALTSPYILVQGQQGATLTPYMFKKCQLVMTSIEIVVLSPDLPPGWEEQYRAAVAGIAVASKAQEKKIIQGGTH